MKKHLAVLLLALFLAAVPLSAQAQGAREESVALLPFTVHADRDLGFLQAGLYDMMASRLSWEGRVAVKGREESFRAAKELDGPITAQAAEQIGKKASADYVIFGSLTSLGDSVSIDATVLPLAAGEKALRFSQSAESLGKVIPAVDALCADINFSVFGRGSPPAAAAPMAPAPSRSNPEQSFRQESGMAAPGAVAAAAAVGGPVRDFWISQTFSTGLTSLCVADVDGDKAEDVITADQDTVWAYRWASGRLAGMCNYKVGRYVQILWLDAADIDSDGKAEVYVTALNTNGQSLVSFVLAYDGKAFSVTAKDQPWYFRVLSAPGRGKVLYGQRRGLSDLYLPGVSELALENGKYVSKGGSLAKAQCVFGTALGRFVAPDQDNVAVLTDKGGLYLYSGTGERLYKSDEDYGGNEKYMRQPGSESANNVSYLPQRLLVTEGRDGIDGLLVVKNEGTTGRLFDRFRMYTSGRFFELSWNGLGLAPEWSTEKVSGLITDYGLGDVDGDGVTELVVAVVKRSMSKDRSNIISYDFKKLKNN